MAEREERDGGPVERAPEPQLIPPAHGAIGESHEHQQAARVNIGSERDRVGFDGLAQLDLQGLPIHLPARQIPSQRFGQ